MEKIIVTGGGEFIGSAVSRHLINQSDHTVINFDGLTLAYAGNLDSLKEVDNSPRHHFELADICDSLGVQKVFEDYRDGTYRREQLGVGA